MNIQLFQIINSWAGKNQWFDLFMIFSAEWLGYILVGLLLTLFIKNRQKYQVMVIVSLASAVISRFVFVEIIRFFYDNPRPFLALQDVISLVDHEATPSFPSGHATFYFALATVVYLYNKKVGIWYLFTATLIGFARIFVGVHWPLDVIGGAALGSLTAISVYYIKQKMPIKGIKAITTGFFSPRQ